MTVDAAVAFRSRGKTHHVFTNRAGGLTCTCSPTGEPCEHIEHVRSKQPVEAVKQPYQATTYQSRSTGSTADSRYAKWRATRQGQAVYKAFVDRALDLRDRGWDHWGGQAIVEAIRFDHAMRVGPDGEGFVVNNSVVSRMTRDAMAERERLRGFFEIRAMTT